jgi:hypothetical protein
MKSNSVVKVDSRSIWERSRAVKLIGIGFNFDQRQHYQKGCENQNSGWPTSQLFRPIWQTFLKAKSNWSQLFENTEFRLQQESELVMEPR